MMGQATSGRPSPPADRAKSGTAPDARPSVPGTGYSAGLVAVLSAVLVYVVGATTEIAAIRLFRPTEIELTWLSDAVLAIAFGWATFLWLHLKRTRWVVSRLERSRIVVDTQLALAADIQRALLPRLPPASDGVQWAARLEQAGRIGGDLYDIVQPTPDSWLVLVGDVSGKGIPAALVLASVRTMFRMMSQETVEPGALVTRISRALHEDNGGLPYLTCIVLRIDCIGREIAYVNAGHPPGLVFDGSRSARRRWLLDSNGPPAGLFPNQAYQTASLVLSPGAICVLVTDGITEAFDELRLSGTDPIGSIVAESPDLPSPEHICDALIERTTPALSRDGDGWQDDRTVVAFLMND
jgi:serine phosphatase RsbU (regulator of sigma subunit)